MCIVIYIRHVGRTKPRVGHTDWQHDNRDHCQWPAKPDCPRWVFVRFVVLECSVSDDVEGKGSHGDSWRKPLPTPTKPWKDSNANHLFNVIVKTVGLCCVQQYILKWVLKIQFKLTVNPADDKGFPETVEKETHTRCAVKVKNLKMFCLKVFQFNKHVLNSPEKQKFRPETWNYNVNKRSFFLTLHLTYPSDHCQSDKVTDETCGSNEPLTSLSIS